MLELLAAVGLILPAIVDIAPVVVPITAVCAFIAWGRLSPESFVV